MIRSFPAPPSTTSESGPPLMRSAPPRPALWSSPALPRMVSAPAVPVRRSSREDPLRSAATVAEANASASTIAAIPPALFTAVKLGDGGDEGRRYQQLAPRDGPAGDGLRIVGREDEAALTLPGHGAGGA